MDYEDLLEKFYTKIIKANDSVIDVGAHTGRHTKLFSKLCGIHGQILAFEPNPVVIPWLEANLQTSIANGVVTVLPCAVSSKNDHTSFIITNNRLEESGLKKRKYNGPTTFTEVEVDMVTLDSCSALLNGRLSYIKIDVEGNEFEVLKGARKIILEHRPVISFEFGESSYFVYDVDPSSVYDFITALNYEVYSILGNRLDKTLFVAASKKQSFWDYIASPVEKKDYLIHVFTSVLNTCPH